MSIPQELLLEEDLSELEDRCIALIFEHSSSTLSRRRASFFEDADDHE
ncbi:hypothetical protein CP98_03125 [Sphingobium yanoikuyae]|nr:hypothetical protein CP98_03125 [Sphingobium yanoikuyae]